MSKKAGAVAAETKEHIIKAAIEEFATYGFAGASVRRICNGAGVTTGALYFFFEGKDDLFRTVLSRVTVPFMAFMTKHFESEENYLVNSRDECEESDMLVAHYLVDSYFRDQEIWDILLANYAYPFVKDFWNSFAALSCDHYMDLLRKSAQHEGKQLNVERSDLHLFVHMLMEAIVTLLSHHDSKDEMEKHSRVAMQLLWGAFHALA